MRNNWTREETIIAINVYCKIAFKSISKTNPTISKYANLLGRTPSALNMKIGNIGRLDPTLKEQNIVGLSHGSKTEEEVWNEFYNNPEKLSYESEILIAQLMHKSLEQSANIDLNNLPQGKERIIEVKQRVNQSFFRSCILSSYNFQCCISGISNPVLLDASQIVEWSKDEKNRLNPTNGLCMNSLFHKAYDNHLITITPDFKIIVSDKMKHCSKDGILSNYFTELNQRKIMLPEKFLPKQEFLEIHYHEYLKNQ